MKDSSINSEDSSTLDIVGITCSSVCVLHCLAFPVLLTFLPSITAYLEGEVIHKVLLALIFPVSTFSFMRQYHLHHKLIPGFMGFLGIFLLFGAVIFEDFFKELSSINLELIITFIGSAIVSLGHILNIRYSKRAFL